MTPRTGPLQARFYCVNDGVPVETTALLREACLRRHIEYIEVEASSFDYRPERELSPGDLLYRPAVSTAAMRVEQFLTREGVATFHSDPEGAFFDCTNSPLLMQRAGVPIPRTVYCSTTNRDVLRDYVAQLGGFPIVFKLLGGSGGVGVMRVDSSPALFSLVDHALSRGSSPLLCAYVGDAVHWRVVVVGSRAVAAYRNTPEPDDFRTNASTNASDSFREVPPALAEVAIRAVHALRCEHGGVDVLEHASGRLFVLEANFPCYFPQAQQVAGIDIAGMMVEHLLAKAERLRAASASAKGAAQGSQ